MATLLPRRHSKQDTRRRPNDGRCKKHPKHQQSPGVCSLCLTEKLSHLNNNSNPISSRRASATARSSNGGSSTASSLSSYYSSSGSSCSTPQHQKVTLSSLLSGGGTGNNVLRKSRSLAFVPRSMRPNNRRDVVVVDRNEKKKSGFWSKFFRHKRSSVREINPKFMQHSRTVRERSFVFETL